MKMRDACDILAAHILTLESDDPKIQWLRQEVAVNVSRIESIVDYDARYHQDEVKLNPWLQDMLMRYDSPS